MLVLFTEASKVQLLKAENRRLVNELQTNRGMPTFDARSGGVTSESRDSWDSDEANNSPLTSYGRDLKTQSMEEYERTQSDDGQHDDDVKQVVAMLENVDFMDTLPVTSDEQKQHSDVTPEDGDSGDGQLSGDDGDSTPRDVTTQRHGRHADRSANQPAVRKITRFRLASETTLGGWYMFLQRVYLYTMSC